MFKKIDSSEKKIVSIAIFFVIGHLFLIAYSATSLSITVPTCEPGLKLFDKPGIRNVGSNRFEAHYVSKMWAFEPRKLLVPTGATIDFVVAATDVNHGFHIQDTNVNTMAIPGVVTKVTHTFKKSGIYNLVCHEYCGYGHQNMYGTIEVSDKITEAQFGDASLSLDTGTNQPGLTAFALPGEKLFKEKTCVACHSLDGTNVVGPTVKGIFGRTQEMQDGQKLTVDEAYLTESIKNPQAKLVKGFGPLMPNLNLTDEETKQIVEYLKTIK